MPDEVAEKERLPQDALVPREENHPNIAQCAGVWSKVERIATPPQATAGAFCGLVAWVGNEYCQSMKTLTVQEASKSLGDWLRRAVSGEQIAIHEGECIVLLHGRDVSSERKTFAETCRILAECFRVVAHRGRAG